LAGVAGRQSQPPTANASQAAQESFGDKPAFNGTRHRQVGASASATRAAPVVPQARAALQLCIARQVEWFPTPALDQDRSSSAPMWADPRRRHTIEPCCRGGGCRQGAGAFRAEGLTSREVVIAMTARFLPGAGRSHRSSCRAGLSPCSPTTPCPPRPAAGQVVERGASALVIHRHATTPECWPEDQGSLRRFGGKRFHARVERALEAVASPCRCPRHPPASWAGNYLSACAAMSNTSRCWRPHRSWGGR